MKILRPLIFFCTILTCKLHGTGTPSAESIEQVRQAYEAISAFHEDGPKMEKFIRLVYFYPKGRKPLKDWRERLARSINDINNFYAEQLQTYGLPYEGLPFERDRKGRPVFHLVKGKHPASEYNYDSGSLIETEIRNKLGSKIDFDNEHVLAIHALSEKDDEGHYIFNSPYYGNGDHIYGFSHVSDCELQDPLHLGDTDRSVRLTDHQMADATRTLAAFNSSYIGGMAHELGHAIGLEHDMGGQIDSSQSGISLMSNGNHNYRENLWRGNHPAYLSTATVLRLISSPLLTRSKRKHSAAPQAKIQDIKFSHLNDNTKVEGKIQSSIPTYAITAYVWGPIDWPGDPTKDHHSRSQPFFTRDGEFVMEGTGFPPGDYRLRFTSFHLNGALANFDFRVTMDEDRNPNIDQLNNDWLISQAVEAIVSGITEQAQTLLADESSLLTPETLRKRSVLLGILSPDPPIDLSTTTLSKLSLSDADWSKAAVGWGSVARNHYAMDALDSGYEQNLLLNLQDQFYYKGLYAHPDSRYEFDLNSRWKTFNASFGLQNGAYPIGSAVFIIKGDGKELFRSTILRAAQIDSINLDVSQVNKLELITQGGEGHINGSWAIWVDPIISR